MIFPYNFVIFEQRNRASIRFGLCVFRPNDEQSELAHTFPHGYAFVNHSNSPNDYSECGTGFSHLKASERFGAEAFAADAYLIYSGGAKNEDLKSG